MRENRLSGSEGGGTEINRPSLPLSGTILDHHAKEIMTLCIIILLAVFKQQN